MKNIWWFVIGSVIVQEPVSTDAVIFQIRHLHLNLLIVNSIWVIATVFDIWFGYTLGKFIQKKIANTKFEQKVLRLVKGVEHFMGKKGEWFTLVLLGIINFPYANSFLASWLSISKRDVFICLFIGDVLYWGIEWMINIGVRSFVKNPQLALVGVLGGAVVLSIVSKVLVSKIVKSPNKNPS